jgi:hypothetical protein
MLENKRFVRPAVSKFLPDTVMNAILRLQQLLEERRYRPEAHYMRGPGPKSRARAQAQPSTRPE